MRYTQLDYSHNVCRHRRLWYECIVSDKTGELTQLSMAQSLTFLQGKFDDEIKGGVVMNHELTMCTLWLNS